MSRRKSLYPKYDRAGRQIDKAIKGTFKALKPKKRRRKKGCGLVVIVLLLLVGVLLIMIASL